MVHGFQVHLCFATLSGPPILVSYHGPLKVFKHVFFINLIILGIWGDSQDYIHAVGVAGNTLVCGNDKAELKLHSFPCLSKNVRHLLIWVSYCRL